MPLELYEEWDTVRSFLPTDGGTDPVMIVSLESTRTGFVAVGEFEDGRSWGVQPLAHGAANLGVWRPGISSPRLYDDVWRYSNIAIAALAAPLWAGRSVEPRWWERHTGSRRQRSYGSDGTYTEAVLPEPSGAL